MLREADVFLNPRQQRATVDFLEYQVELLLVLEELNQLQDVRVSLTVVEGLDFAEHSCPRMPRDLIDNLYGTLDVGVNIYTGLYWGIGTFTQNLARQLIQFWKEKRRRFSVKIVPHELCIANVEQWSCYFVFIGRVCWAEYLHKFKLLFESRERVREWIRLRIELLYILLSDAWNTQVDQRVVSSTVLLIKSIIACLTLAIRFGDFTRLLALQPFGGNWKIPEVKVLTKTVAISPFVCEIYNETLRCFDRTAVRHQLIWVNCLNKVRDHFLVQRSMNSRLTSLDPKTHQKTVRQCKFSSASAEYGFVLYLLEVFWLRSSLLIVN